MEVSNKKYNNIYFIGIGGIGMSNLARYFLLKGANVGGYDRSRTDLTRTLFEEVALVHYEDDATLIPDEFTEKSNTLIFFTLQFPQHIKSLIILKIKASLL